MEAEGRPPREPRWGVQLGISQGGRRADPGASARRTWASRLRELQHIRQPPPRGGAKQVRLPRHPARAGLGELHRNPRRSRDLQSAKGEEGREGGAERAGGASPSLSHFPLRPPVAAARARRASRRSARLGAFHCAEEHSAGRAVRLRSAGRPRPLPHRPSAGPPGPASAPQSPFGSSAGPLPRSSQPGVQQHVNKDAPCKKEPELFQTVSEGLRQLYAQKLLPLEEHCRFHEFHSAALEDADFDNKPMVLLVGQYSTGTTFIRHPMEQDFRDAHRPEPTIAVMHGPTSVVPGNALVVDPRRPFRKLNASRTLPQQVATS